MAIDIKALKELIYKLDSAQQVHEALERIPGEVKLEVATIFLTVDDRQLPLSHMNIEQLFHQLLVINADAIQHTREMMHKVIDSPLPKVNHRIDEIPPGKIGVRDGVSAEDAYLKPIKRPSDFS